MEEVWGQGWKGRRGYPAGCPGHILPCSGPRAREFSGLMQFPGHQGPGSGEIRASSCTPMAWLPDYRAHCPLGAALNAADATPVLPETPGVR